LQNVEFGCFFDVACCILLNCCVILVINQCICIIFVAFEYVVFGCIYLNDYCFA